MKLKQTLLPTGEVGTAWVIWQIISPESSIERQIGRAAVVTAGVLVLNIVIALARNRSRRARAEKQVGLGKE